MNANNCTITVYSTGLTEIPDYPRSMEYASNLRFSTGYPGGLYLDCTFYISREIADWWALRGAQRVMVRNGFGQPVYEGYIDSFDYIATDTAQGVQVNCVGAWSKILMSRRIRKIWSDTRTDENTWAWNVTTQPLELWQVDRTNRVRVMAKGGCSYTSATADDAEITYTAPAGQEIKRVTYTYNFNEFAGRSFVMHMEEWTGASWSTITTPVDSRISATGTAALDLTCSTSCTKLKMMVYAQAASDNLDIVADEKNFASWEKISVYSTSASAVDLPAVVTGVRGLLDTINTTDYYVTAMGAPRSLIGTESEPSSFGAFDSETLADVLIRAASFGDGNNARWAVGFRHSELAPVPDGKPVIFCEQYPALTDYDFTVRLDEPNLLAPLTIKQNFGRIYNYIILRYTDDNDKQVYVTPETDASLKDATSIAAYGQRDYLLDVGNASATLAKGNGYRFLAAYKDPQFELTGPVNVRDAIRTKSGLYGPVCQVRAGFRLRIENFISDLTGTATGATFLISATNYDDDTETVSITAGPPDGLIYPVYQRAIKIGAEEITEAVVTRPIPVVGGDGEGGGGGGEDKESKYPMGKGNKAAKQSWEKNPTGKK